MLKQELLKKEQNDLIDRLYEHDHTLVVAPMGGGKTICTLTALAELLDDGVLSSVLVVAPLKVCQTVWKQEATKWAHTAHLDIALAIGSESKRIAAVDSRAQITVINFENLPWLFKQYKGRFDGLVIDELSKLRTPGGKQFKALRPRLADFKWRAGLTGTPVSENWLGLYSMMMCIDGGAALGTRSDVFKRKYFFPTDYMEYNWELHGWAGAVISALISGAVYTMPDYRGELPAIRYENINLTMPSDVRAQYIELLNNSIVEVNGHDVIAESAAVLSGKMQQICNGFAYFEDAPAEFIDDYRIRACLDAVAARPGAVIVCYWYAADRERLVAAMPGAVLLADDVVRGAEAWNKGEIDVLLLHPRSAGHGLNLAAGGCDIIWYSPCWSRDLWEQANARIWRRGQRHDVLVRSIVVADSIDELMCARVADKAEHEALWLEHLTSRGAV